MNTGLPRFLWVMFLFANLGYAGLVFSGSLKGVQEPDWSKFLPDPSQGQELMVVLMAVVSGVGSAVLPRFLSQLAKQGKGKSQLSPQQTALVAWVIRMALLESIGIYGLCAAVLSHNPAKAAPFLLVSLLGILMNAPFSQRSKSYTEILEERQPE